MGTRLSLLLLLLVACQPSGPDATVVVALGSGLSLAEVDYVEVTALQGDQVTRATAGGDGIVRLRVVAGVEVRLAATVFDVGGGRWNAFDGTHIFEPTAGANRVDVDLEAEPLRSGTVQPLFVKETGTELLFFALTAPVPLRIREVATGFEVSAFQTRQSISLPADRDFWLAVVRPDTGGEVEVALDAEAPFGDAFPLDLGAAPVEPATSDVVVTNSDTADLTGVQFEATYSVECASGKACDDASLVWEPCDSDVTLPGSGTEQDLEVWVRYQQVEDLCGSVSVTRDLTNPTATLELTPAFLDTAAPPAIATIKIVPSEELDPLSLAMVASDATQSYACSAGFRAGVWLPEGYPTYLCDLDLSAWAGGTVDLEVTGTDPAGNSLRALGVLPDVTGFGTRVLVVGAHPWPEAPDLGALEPFFLGIDVVNLSPAAVCNFGVSSLVPPILYFAGTSTPVGELSVATGGPLLGLVPGGGGQGTLWIEVSPQPGAIPGDYELQIDVTATDCNRGNAASVPVDELVNLPFTLDPHPFRFAGSEPLQVGALAEPGNHEPGAILGLADTCNGDITVAPDDPALIDTGKDCPEIRPRGVVGSTYVTVTRSNGDKASVRVDIEPTTYVMALQANTVTHLAADGVDSLPVDTRIGTPLRLLWESTLDAVIVVGNSGLQLSSMLTDTVVPAPCSAETIVDAALTSVDPAAGQPHAAVALLNRQKGGTVHHCEVSLDGTVLGGGSLTSVLGKACAAPTRLTSNPITGSFAALGDGCVVEYVSSASSATRISRGADAAAGGRPLQAAMDPFGNFVTLLTDSVAFPAGGWGLGPRPAVSEPFEIDPLASGDASATGVAVDPATATPIVAGIGGARATLMRYVDDRFVSRMPDVAAATGNPGFAWTRLVVDAGHRLLYAADNGQQPAVWTIYVGSFAFLFIQPPGVRFLPPSGPVIDLAVVGPQPVGAHPRTARPGHVITVHGTGFAGGGQDEAFVLGVRAEVLDSSPTAVRLRIPYALAALQRDVRAARITIRSHGRMSGPVPGSFLLEAAWPSRLYRASGPLGPACMFGGCDTATLVQSETELFAVDVSKKSAGVWAIGAATAIPGAAPEHGVLLPGARRLVGPAGGSLYDFELLPGPRDFEQARSVQPGLTGPLGAMAVDPAGRVLVIQDGVTLTALWATTLAQIPGLTLATPSLTGITFLEFLPDGSAVVAATTAGNVEVFDIASGSATAVTPDPATCPAPARINGMWPRYRDRPELFVALSNPGSTILAAGILREQGGAYSLVCTSQVASTHTHVSLSPLGDALVVLESAWTTGAYSVRLLDPDDLTHEYDYAADLGSGGPLRLLAGHHGRPWQDYQQIAIAAGLQVDSGTIHAGRIAR